MERINLALAYIRPKLKTDKNAAMGIGTLIIFIAMVLVAAIAAGVIIQMGLYLQQQAEQTGYEAVSDISTSFIIIDIVGDRIDPNDPQALSDPGNKNNWQTSIQSLEIQLKLGSGSPPVDLDHVLIEISDGFIERNLQFNDSYPDETDASHADDSWFTASEIFDPKGAYDTIPNGNNFLTTGSIIKIYINIKAAGLDLSSYKSVTINIIPKHGLPIIENFYTPSGFSTRYIEVV